MKFYLSLTDADGVLLDRFRLEVEGNPEDEYVGEDSEMIGGPLAKHNHYDLVGRLQRVTKHHLKAVVNAKI